MLSTRSHRQETTPPEWDAGAPATGRPRSFGWLALVVAAFVLGVAVGTKNVDPNTAGPGESGRMNEILDAGFKQPAGESVLIQSTPLASAIPPSPRRSRTWSPACRRWPRFRTFRSPLAPGNAGQIAKGKDAALVEFDIRGDRDKAGDKVGPVVDAVADAQRAHPNFFIGEFGDASAAKASQDIASRTTSRAPVCTRSRSR